MRYAAQRLDQAALARAGHARDAHADGVAAVRQAVFDDLLGQLAIGGASAFDQRDGLGQDGAVAAEDAVDVFLRA